MIEKLSRLSGYLYSVGLNEHAAAIEDLVKEAAPLGDIKDIDEDAAKQMEALEDIYFGPYGRAESAEEILEDIKEEDLVTGVIFTSDKPEEENQVKGYLYGFKYSDWEYEIEWDDITCFSEECQDKDAFSKHVSEEASEGRVLYVSNLLVDKSHRHRVVKILDGFLEKVREGGFSYIVFDAMEKTLNMIMLDGKPNKKREARFGLRVVGKTGYDAFIVKVV